MPASLEDCFADGVLIRPRDDQWNLIHLARALAGLAGAANVAGSAPERDIMDWIGPAENLVFILLDGLGMNTLRRLPADSFLASHLQAQIHSTCPSTTACALTAIATAGYANQHAITGWFTHLPEHDATAITLPFLDRFTHRPLAERGLQPRDVIGLPPILPQLTHRPLSLSPAALVGTSYNQFVRGGTPGAGYHTTAEVIDQIIAHVTDTDGPTYTYAYLYEIDTLCHRVGVEHPQVISLVMGIDAELRRLAAALAGRARIVITADHGLIDVPPEHQTLLFHGDPLLDLLAVPPSGDARMPVFHLRPGRQDAFIHQFNERFADRMFLLDLNQAQRLELFGPGPPSPRAKLHFGDFVAIPHRPATLAYHPPDRPLGHLYLAVHAGLSPQEMQVPVCLV
jgi:hypothetical protein